MLWGGGSNGGGLREGEGEAVERFDRELGFYLGFQVFLRLCKRGFLKEEGEKNEKARKVVLVPRSKRFRGAGLGKEEFRSKSRSRQRRSFKISCGPFSKRPSANWQGFGRPYLSRKAGNGHPAS